ncbi:GNAT family N-acetyltransferase [Bacillus sp. JJ664]
MQIIQQSNQEDTDYIRQKVIEYNMSKLPEKLLKSVEKVSFILKNEHESILGGITGTIKYNHLHVDFLWVDESQRGTGYGSNLLHKIEDLAKEKKCRLIVLDSFSFQAPEFYKKHGYKEFGVLNDYPEGFSQHFFEKRLYDKY